MSDEEEKYHDFLQGEGSNKDLNPELVEFLNKVSNAELPGAGRSKASIWSEIDSATNDNSGHRKVTINLWQILSVAAVITLLIVALPWLMNTKETKVLTYQADLATTQEVDLPDGSHVSLNAQSNLSYAEGDERIAKLEGEAFFEVEEGVPFKVVTREGTVTVLGTSFNVKARDGFFLVSCKTGKVRVEIPEKKIVEDITPGERVIHDKDTVRRTKINANLIGKWQVGEFYFDDQPLEEVLKELERQYNVEITTKDLEQKFFTGYFTNTNLDLALTIVCEPLDLSYRIDTDGLVTIEAN